MKRPRRRAAPTPAPERVPERLVTLLWYTAVALTAWSFGYTIMRGSDLWWHIAGGRWMVEQGTWRVFDPYSFTAAGVRWLNDAWLSDVLLYLWVQAFGMESLALWKWGLIVATWVLLFHLTARLSGDRLASYVAITIGLAVAAPFLDVRPQLYSFLFWVILMLGSLVQPQPKIWLPLVMLVWVNLHASFLLGVITLPLLLLPAAVAGGDRRRLLAIGGACLLACLLNPNGAEVFTRPLRYALDPSSPFRTLGEWLPPFQPGGIQSPAYPWGIGVFVTGIIVILLLGRESGSPEASADARGRNDQARSESARYNWGRWAVIAVGVLTLAMSLRSRRFVPFFAMAQALVMAQALALLLRPVAAAIPKLLPPLAATALALFWLAPYPRSLYAFDYMTAEFEFPVETLNFIETNQLSGNVFALYNWGGYIHLRTGGRMRVFIDGRSETVYSDETFLQYMQVLQEAHGWKQVVEGSGAQFVLWPRRQTGVINGLIGDGWQSLYRDYQSVLLARRDVGLGRTTAPPPTAHQLLAVGYETMLQGDYADAQRMLQQALEREPHLQPACTSLVQAQLLARNVAAAETTIERCRQMYPNPDRDRLLESMLAKVRANPAS
ncbi:MAG TPA: tetratricopeptide repeat protein [Terriglobales bacterium]|nr:tetratricopeptide repeat protein [Terriglobales bacterium]